MGTRGRRSSAEIAVIGPHGLETIRRPAPPASLTDEQAQEWRQIVSSMAANYFSPETHALLEARCRHVIWGRRLAQAIEAEEKSPDFDMTTYQSLLRAAAEQSRVITILDTKMRLAQQTTYDRREPKRKSAGLKTPWEGAS
jgi:hypothetical protein